MREFVFFEALFQTDCAHTIPMFNSGTSQDGLETMTHLGGSVSGLQGQRSQAERRKQLQEKLLRVPFDRALEEEKILNTVFPSQDIQRHQIPLNQQKTDALDEDIFKTVKVPRCFEFCAYEYFQTYDDAVGFRRGIKCSLIFFIVAVFMKNVAQIALSVTDNQTFGNLNVMIVLDFIEMIITLYTMYSLHIFSICLQQGKIQEYEPLRKYYWFAFLIFFIVIQKFLVHIITESVVKQSSEAENHYSLDYTFSEKHQLAMQINVLLRSTELLIFLYGLIKHFQIKREDINTHNSYIESLRASPIGSKRAFSEVK
eukprot:403376244